MANKPKDSWWDTTQVDMDIVRKQSPKEELGDVNQIQTDVGQQFVDDAPDLPFKLPFGLGKLFHRMRKNQKQRRSFKAP